MYWYSIQDKSNSLKSLINFFNQQTDTYAFIPKIEKWFNVKRVKKYVVKEMYPDYIFVKSCLNEDEFKEKYQRFLSDINGLASLVKQGDSLIMDKEIQSIYECLFNDKGVIEHSIGNIVESKLIIDQGPIKGLEKYVIKINRHHRFALLQLNDGYLKVPLEVVSKS